MRITEKIECKISKLVYPINPAWPSMSTVLPKRLYSPEKGGDLPVWEIRTRTGRCIYYERLHHDGYKPVGLLDQFMWGDTLFSVAGTVNEQNVQPQIHKCVDGYVAPMSWYQKVEEEEN